MVCVSHTGDTILIGFCRYMGEISYWAADQRTACVSDMPGQQCVRTNAFLLRVPNTLTFASPFADLAPDFVKPYKINEKMINQAFELKHGKSIRTFNTDNMSNWPFAKVSCTKHLVIIQLMFFIYRKGTIRAQSRKGEAAHESGDGGSPFFFMISEPN
jgi:hypothetical protein